MSLYRYGRTIPEFVKRFREEGSLTQTDLGIKIGVHGQYVSNIERGLNKNSVSFCKKLMPLLKPQQRTCLVELLADSISDDVSTRLTN